MENKPKQTPRCSCGMVSEYHCDPYDEEYYVSKCWRCLEIQWMKDSNNSILKSLLPMDTNQVDRFIEIVMDESVLLKTVTVKWYKGKNDG